MALVFAISACGSDSDGASDDKGASATTTSADATTTEPEAEATSVEATLTDEAIEGVPEEVPAGVVEVSVTDETEGAGSEINFTRVKDGTTAEAFVPRLEPVFQGGPFPDFLLDTAGTVGKGGSIVLKEGSYIVWMDRASNLERESTSEDIITTPLTVGAGSADATLSEADGTIVTTDYNFELDVPAGPATVNFKNDSDEQYHHVVSHRLVGVAADHEPVSHHAVVDDDHLDLQVPGHVLVAAPQRACSAAGIDQ